MKIPKITKTTVQGPKMPRSWYRTESYRERKLGRRFWLVVAGWTVGLIWFGCAFAWNAVEPHERFAAVFGFISGGLFSAFMLMGFGPPIKRWIEGGGDETSQKDER